LSAIEEGFQDVLLNVLVVVGDDGELLPQARQIFYRLVDAIVVDVIARRLGAQKALVADVLLDEAVAVVAANDRVGEVHIFDFRL